MRSELEQLALVDAYVNNEMNAAESAAFETQMLVNPGIQEAVELQQLLVTAINRKALLAVATAAAPIAVPPRSGSILASFKWPIILSSIVIGGIITWLSMRSDNAETPVDKDNIRATQQPSAGGQNSLLAIHNDSLEDAIATPNYEVVRTTNMQSTNRREFGGLETWISPEVQQIVVDPTKDELIECKDGTVILVPKNAFADADGNAISEPVTLEIIEALTMDKIVAYNLVTTSNGEALKSGGMVYVQPTLNGTELALAEGKALHIEIPTDDYDPNMKAWEGIADGNGNLNWENPKEIENYLIPVSMNSLDFLPDGFRDEVSATLPFKGYKLSSKTLEDSLYFSMGNTNVKNTNPLSEKSQLNSKINQSEPKSTGRSKLVKRKTTQKIPKGIAVIQFVNLPKDANFIASYFIGKREISDTLRGNQIRTDFLGSSSMSINGNGCSPFAFKRVEFKSGEITTLDCSEWNCGTTNGPVPILSAASSAATSCFINPSSVFSIHTPEFENTFIATREFQERLQALHKIKNAQALFDLYVNQLDKNLFEIDKQVAARTAGNDKIVFEQFAAQKLTTVKTDGQEYSKLKQFYTSQVKKQQQEVNNRQREYNQKSAEELQEIQEQIATIRSNYLTDQQQIRKKYSSSPIVNSQMASTSTSVPRRSRVSSKKVRPSVGRQPTYKVNWFGTGWMNIDSYLHELSKGKKQIPIAVAASDNMTIYQSVNSLNTLLSLNNVGGEYNAYFPSSQNPIFAKSIALGVSRADGKLKVAAQFFNPYASSGVALSNWEEVTEDEFKERLRDLYPGGQTMLNGLESAGKGYTISSRTAAKS